MIDNSVVGGTRKRYILSSGQSTICTLGQSTEGSFSEVT